MSKHLLVLTSLLVTLGLVVFLYKALVLEVPVTANPSQENWTVEAHLAFIARGGPVKVDLMMPLGGPNLNVLDEGFTSRGFGVTSEKIGIQRQTVWAIRNTSGPRNLFYRGRFRSRNQLTQAPPSEAYAPPKAEPETEPVFEGSTLHAAKSLLARMQARSADRATLAVFLLNTLIDPAKDENAALLMSGSKGKQTGINVAVKVLTLAKIPARAVHGVRLELNRRKAPVINWLEVWDGKKWLAIHKDFTERKVPVDILPWWVGPGPLVKIQGGRRLEVTLTVARAEESRVSRTTGDGSPRRSPLLRFSTQSLPSNIQGVYRVILMLPLGALLVVLIRNVIGFKTFGTFMPVLIAMAFRQTELARGVMLFVVIVLAGLGVRFYLEQLKLLLVPRLAVVMTMVVLIMTAFSILSHQLGLEAGLSIALFPMVILTMVIERMMVVWDERGAKEAFTQGLGSLVAAILAYLVMNIDALQYLIFVFPELLLLLVAVLLLLGRYAGYRLTELPRFRPLARKEG